MVRNNTFAERRSAPRFSSNLPVIVRRKSDIRPGAEVPTYDAFCIDISHAGIRIGSAELFQLREMLELTLCSPEGGADLTCDAEVLRLGWGRGHYEIAARIVSVAEFAESGAEEPAASNA
jgi:hypothetical protein